MSKIITVSQAELNGQLARALASNYFATVQEHKRTYGVESAHDLSSAFIACVVAGMAYRVLSEEPKRADKAAMEKSLVVNYTTLKGSVCNAVAAGFTGAMSKWAKKSVEYYCQVKLVPKPTSKLPC